MKRVCKDSQAVKDYSENWAPFLAGDLITASTWTPDPGITVNSSQFTTTTTTVWVSGGTPGLEYSITNHITTAGGRQEDETIVFLISEE